MPSSPPIDLFSPVKDWKSNIHVAHNPRGIRLEDCQFSDEWKRLFSIPYVEQSDPVTLEANPVWLKLKEDFISGSEVGSCLGDNHYPNESAEDFILYKSKRKTKVFSAESLAVMNHGKRHESRVGDLYSHEIDDITFKFGLIPHPDPKWRFLGVSPDLIAFNNSRLVEIKCPAKRSILWGLNVDEVHYDDYRFSDDIRVLMRDVLISGDRHKYLCITNLPVAVTGLMNKMIYYRHQIMLQWEVLRIGDYIDFVQFGTAPNRSYWNTDLLTITSVPADPTWIHKYGDQLRRAWDEVEYLKRNPDIKKCAKRQADASWSNLSQNSKGTDTTDDATAVCPLPHLGFKTSPLTTNRGKRTKIIPSHAADDEDDCPFIYDCRVTASPSHTSVLSMGTK